MRLKNSNLKQSGVVLNCWTLEVQDNFAVNAGKRYWTKFSAVNALGVDTFDTVLLKLGINLRHFFDQ